MVAPLGFSFSSAAKAAEKVGIKTASSSSSSVMKSTETAAAKKLAEEAAAKKLIEAAAAKKLAEELAAAQAAKAAAARAAVVATVTAGATAGATVAGNTAAKDAGAIAQKGAQLVVKDTAAVAQSTVKQTSKEAANSAAKFTADHPKLVIGGIAATALAAAATVKFEENNNKKLTISATAPASNGTLITFSPKTDILKTDNLDISGTNAIDGVSVAVLSVVSNSQVIVATKSTSPGTGGQLVLHTSFEGQVTGQMAAAAGAVVGAGVSVAGSAAAAGLKAAGLPSPAELVAKLSAYKYYFAAGITLLLVLKFWPRRRTRQVEI